MGKKRLSSPVLDIPDREQRSSTSRSSENHISTKTRGGYDLAQAERTAIRQVREVHPEWHPQEPRPLVVFSEWQLPHDIFGYSPEYYYQFRFRMTTRDDLFLDAVPMVWGPDKVPPVTCVEAEAGRRSSSSRRLRGVVLVLSTCDTNVIADPHKLYKSISEASHHTEDMNSRIAES
ncbi:hypothetical protein TNCV_734961 [Trichonephila clavipes]|uniref:Uncharacterized protein n=1 Tax=Trichonephila clavipes TaxID=2585209 RepID=A0A8X6SW46_TRICX|nr:hypothetical protein TNCV_734961 [Trichonephila clavipes]